MKTNYIKVEEDNDGIPQLTFVQSVEIGKRHIPFKFQGNFFRAVEVSTYRYDSCHYCSIDSLCTYQMAELCDKICWDNHKTYILKLLGE